MNVLKNNQRYKMKKILILGLTISAIVLTVSAYQNDQNEVTPCKHEIDQDTLYVKCPFDNNSGIWTGRTKVVNSRIWYIMKCVSGHEFLSPTAS